MSQAGTSQPAEPLGPVAVIGGTGDLGFGLALRWALAGVPVVIGSRDRQRADDAALRIQNLATQAESPLIPQKRFSVVGLENSDAAGLASTVVVSVPFAGQAAIVKSIRLALKNDCIIVDTTVPLAATVGGKATRLLGVWQGSAAEQTRELVPEGIPVLAAFHSLSASALQELAEPLDCDILVCGDDAAAKERFFPLVRIISGLRPLDAGPLEAARIVESITALLIGLNRRYKIAHAGLRITGLPPQ